MKFFIEINKGVCMHVIKVVFYQTHFTTEIEHLDENNDKEEYWL